MKNMRCSSKKKYHWLLTLILIVGLASQAFGAEVWPPPLGQKNITYLLGPFDTSQSISNVGKILLEQMGYKVDLKLLETGLVYEALATKTGDLFSTGYLPGQQQYLNKHSDKVEILAPSYGPVYDGLAVPGYVPISSIEDLKKPEIRKRLGGKIIGIDAGSGTMLTAEKAMKAYGLDDYDLLPASSPAMEASFKAAYEKGEWIVVVGWCPTAMCELFNPKFLKDSKGIFADAKDYHIVRRGFRSDYPRATALLSRLHLYEHEIRKIVFWIRADGLKPDKAAERFIEKNPALVWWWAGDLIPGLKKPDSLK